MRWTWALAAVAWACAVGGCGDDVGANGDAAVAVDTLEEADGVDTVGVADTVEGEDAAPDGVDAEPDGGDGGTDTTPVGPGWLGVLETLTDYETLRGPAWDLKFLAWVAGAERVAPLTEACAFQDMARWEYHLTFLRSFEPWAALTAGDYLALVLNAQTRIWWGGGVRFDTRRSHPVTGELGVALWNVYSAEQDGGLTVADVVAADAVLAPCLAFAGEQRAFWALSVSDRRFVAEHAEALSAAGIAVIVGR